MWDALALLVLRVALALLALPETGYRVPLALRDHLACVVLPGLPDRVVPLGLPAHEDQQVHPEYEDR